MTAADQPLLHPAQPDPSALALVLTGGGARAANQVEALTAWDRIGPLVESAQ